MITLSSGIGNYIVLNNKTYSYFAGNDYLGLANHPEIVKESVLALEKYGVNFAASRQTTGTSEIHLELEQMLAEFKLRDDALVFASGYMGNKLILHALKDKYSVIYADSMAHSSILDGIPPYFSRVVFYEHGNAGHLEELLKKSRQKRPLIITDGIFALTGEIAPVGNLYSLAEKYGAILVVDEAHATGVLGANGRGTAEYFGIGDAENFYQSETMSKALGSYGGFISSSKEFIEKIRNHSAFYGASTALPPSSVAAGCASLRLIKKSPCIREKLMSNAAKVREGVKGAGFETSNGSTPIVPLFFGDGQTANHLSAFLEENRIIAPSINYPVKMEKFIVRVTVSASHTEEQIENLIGVLTSWQEKHGK